MTFRAVQGSPSLTFVNLLSSVLLLTWSATSLLTCPDGRIVAVVRASHLARRIHRGCERGGSSRDLNNAGSVRWMTQGEVVDAERGGHLAFEIRMWPLKITRREYLVVPDNADLSTCSIVEEWADLRPGWFRAPADLMFGSRTKTNHCGRSSHCPRLKGTTERATPLGGHQPEQRRNAPTDARPPDSPSRWQVIVKPSPVNGRWFQDRPGRPARPSR